MLYVILMRWRLVDVTVLFVLSPYIHQTTMRTKWKKIQQKKEKKKGVYDAIQYVGSIGYGFPFCIWVF